MAARHWTYMISGDGGMKLHPMIELAKYYEHRKDIGAALEMTKSHGDCSQDGRVG